MHHPRWCRLKVCVVSRMTAALWLTRWRQFVTVAFTSTPTSAWELTRSQCKLASKTVMRSERRSCKIIRADALNIDWSRRTRQAVYTACYVPYTGGSFSSGATGLWRQRTGRPTPTLYDDSSRYLMRLHGWSCSYVALTSSLSRLPVYTGCASRSASSLRSLWWHIKFFMGLNCITSTSSSVCLIYKVGVVSALPALIAWLWYNSNCPLFV